MHAQYVELSRELKFGKSSGNRSRSAKPQPKTIGRGTYELSKRGAMTDHCGRGYRRFTPKSVGERK